jgi:hypothetical protein
MNLLVDSDPDWRPGLARAFPDLLRHKPDADFQEYSKGRRNWTSVPDRDKTGKSRLKRNELFPASVGHYDIGAACISIHTLHEFHQAS